MPDTAFNTLGLDDDLDPVEVVASVETAFTITITDEEAAHCRTVGDLYDIVRNRFAATEGEAGRCVTAMAFHRVRGVLTDGKAGPRTRLDSLTELPANRSLARLRQATGLAMPAAGLARLGQAGAWSILLGMAVVVPVALFAPRLWPAFVGLFAIGALLIRLDAGQVKPSHRTLGGLSRSIAALNFGKLAAEGGRAAAPDLWRALTEVLAQHSSLPKADMTPRTALLARQRR